MTLRSKLVKLESVADRRREHQPVQAMTDRQLAAAMGVSLERVQQMSDAELWAIADACGCTTVIFIPDNGRDRECDETTEQLLASMTACMDS